MLLGAPGRARLPCMRLQCRGQHPDSSAPMGAPGGCLRLCMHVCVRECVCMRAFLCKLKSMQAQKSALSTSPALVCGAHASTE